MVSSAKLDSDWLFDSLKKFPPQSEIKTWWLAYSGGVDSQVLLHLLSHLKQTHNINIQAVYIDHGLQQESKQWQQHCADSCQLLSIPFQSISVHAQASKGESPEATAREVRYQALAQLIKSDDCLLTAQHQDDQAETFLLQLFRSAGAAGLAAMPFYTKFSAGWHLRPLLNINQQQILDYAKQHKLSWVEDPSNKNNKYDRNLIRNTFMPLLKKRWPSIEKTISNASQQQAENKSLLEELASGDLSEVNSANESLSIDDLKKLSEPRCRNVLRYWIKQKNIDIAPRKVMQQIMHQLFNAKNDGMPEIKWSSVVVHRFKNRLYVLKSIEHDAAQVLHWFAKEVLVVDSLNIKIKMKKVETVGLKEEILNNELQVKFRQGGEKIMPVGREGRHDLKKLFQEAEVPPWLRPQTPLIYLDDELIAVAGFWIADKYSSAKAEIGYWPEVINI